MIRSILCIGFLLKLFTVPLYGADGHSYANMDQVSATHLNLDLLVDFDNKILKGTAEYNLAYHDKKARTLILDTRDLTIHKIETASGKQGWKRTSFMLSARDAALGSKLRIDLPEGVDKVRIHYETRPEASGLQWLTPAQTAEKKHPFLFSQSQAIHARSWIPIQDSPAVRLTYTAHIKTPKALLAVMSAENDPNTPRDGDYHFAMPQKIPPYLIAIGVGDLYFKPMSTQTGIYAEKYILDAAAEEFSDTQRMIDATEELYGPYSWGRYDLLMLPPSFPFGGMENPRLSFITPTVVAGDKSLVSLIAHELAHSWSGNLVTNSSWNDLWINEGFTSYVENRIMEVVYGKERAVMEQVLGVQDLMDSLGDLKPEYRSLLVDLKGRDPDEAFNNVPYTKGQLFLMQLEEKFGRENFDTFLKGYFKKFAFQTMDSPTLITYLNENLLQKHPGVITLKEINFWINDTTMPTDRPRPVSDVFTKVAQYQTNWLSGKITLDTIPTNAWTVHEWLKFITTLPEDITVERLVELDRAFALTTSRNNEIAHAWLLQALRHDYRVVRDRLEEYLISIGRRKLIVPLYKELAKTEEGMTWARAVFVRARPGYHPLAQGTVDKTLGLVDAD